MLRKEAPSDNQKDIKNSVDEEVFPCPVFFGMNIKRCDNISWPCPQNIVIASAYNMIGSEPHEQNQNSQQTNDKN